MPWRPWMFNRAKQEDVNVDLRSIELERRLRRLAWSPPVGERTINQRRENDVSTNESAKQNP
jgi:hypothetical protein